MSPKEYFDSMEIVPKKRYDALHAFFAARLPVAEVAEKYGYTQSSLYSLIRDFRKYLKEDHREDFFFKEPVSGRKETKSDDLKELIVSLRKRYFSVEDIESVANARGHRISYGYIYKVLKEEGFARLPRRSVCEKKNLELPLLRAPVSEGLKLRDEKFHSMATGLFVFLPVIRHFGIDRLIEHSSYPSTRGISRLSSILCFVALKLSGVKRYSHDDLWCMDRGLGLFAGLNVLPKAAWFSSYSSRVDTGMNLSFLKELHRTWVKHGFLSDTSNLDFTTIPYWGESDHLENNWSGKRGKALSCILAVLAQDPESGIIDYGRCDIQHRGEASVVLEYLDFYKQTSQGAEPLKYLVFDSKFTNYENLSKLDDQQIKFLTIRRRGEKILEKIAENRNYKTIRVEAAGLKKRTLKVRDEEITLPGYRDVNGREKQIRQVIITGHGKVKPALIITNDFDLSVEKVVRKYALRWLVEKGISEQIDFFHLNRVSSSMVIKVDFDLVMTLLAHNIYRLFASFLDRYTNFSNERIYEKFIANNGNINIRGDVIAVDLKKKRDLPLILDMTKEFEQHTYSWLGHKTIRFVPAATS
jgi:transposase